MPIYKDDEKHAIRTLAARFEAGHIDFFLIPGMAEEIGVTKDAMPRIIETMARFGMLENIKMSDGSPGFCYRITAACAQAVREWDTERKRKRNDIVRGLLFNAVGGAIAATSSATV